MFTVAVREQWRLADDGPNRKTLIIGNEDWPFPVPLVKEASGWRFDTAAGKEEVPGAANRAQRADGSRDLPRLRHRATTLRAAGTRRQARRRVRDEIPKRHRQGERPGTGRRPRSEAESAGDLVAQAAEEGRPIGGDRAQPSPFHGYYFKILTAQGAAAPGGAKSYVVKGEMSGGFALIAWPAQHDVTGVMTFLVNQDGIVVEKDLGRGRMPRPERSLRITRMHPAQPSKDASN